MSPMSPQSASSARAQERPEASKSPVPAKKPPPPVAAKSNAFRDRIAAFNAPAAAPIQPFKPSGGAPTNFIKKPFVAPPPSRNAYIPPTREPPPIKTYRREEDPEIAERQARDQNDAERAGLVAHDTPKSNEAEEEQAPKISLKERIALLQKQQQEQAERAAAMQKEKPRRPPVAKRTESQDAPAEDSEDTELERVGTGASKPRASVDQARPRTSQDVKSPDSQALNRDLLSENDADQSGAGDTEDAGAESTSVEEDDERPKSRHPPPPAPKPVIATAAAPAQEPEAGDKQDAPKEEEEEEEEEEESEMDAETRRKLELRQRMAKMSGGMGMPGMFGGMPMGGLPPKPPKPAKKKSITDKKAEDSEGYASPQQQVPMFRMPPLPPAQSQAQDDRSLSVEKEEEVPAPVTGSHTAEEVPDVEDVAAQTIQPTPTGEQLPPVPSEKRPAPPPVPTASRPLPPPPPQVLSPGPGSESGDELTDAANTPSAPFQPTPKRASYFASGEQPHDPAERRVPPIPSAGPGSPVASRPPPPPPPTQAPPSRQENLPIRKLDRAEGETDYEGDYDTDMAPEATHKDALKSHARSSSVEEDNIVDEPSSARSPTIPQGMPPAPPVNRPMPPPPPQQPPSRSSTDFSRGAPPPPPVPPPTRNTQLAEDDDEYDPFKYTGPPTGAAPPAPRAAPPPPQGQPPPPSTRPPPSARPPPPMPPSLPFAMPGQKVESEDDDDDELYSSPPPQKSHDRAPPPPPHVPPHQHAPPPLPFQQAPAHPPVDRAVPQPPPQQDAQSPSMPPMEPPPRMLSSRKSLDAGHLMATRSSMDQPRPISMLHQDFMANDIDLGASSHWWTQPNLLPPSLQGRKDVIVDMKQSQAGNTVEKLIKVLYLDYSQTIVSARFEANNVSDVDLEQRTEAPPPRLRPDQLESAYEQFGRQIAKAIESKQNSVVGNGSPFALVEDLFKPFTDALPPISTRAYGALVYANLANASTQSYDEIRPGDIISFRNAKFQGKTGPMHAKYSMDVGKPDHVGVVVEWDGSKKKEHPTMRTMPVNHSRASKNT
ncbi:sh3 domain-containing protein [Stemphylium lycopersici]|uniref:Sh3 domain-containing protein n=1 Tax=Stemphylium lycopersici TaxID=183478 RepID=A0A364N1C4_STELY|nr:sh3 domain-containing protein [Stemphylium lycopersici]